MTFLYAILETEVRLAVLTMGLDDPGMGILHADQKSRDSFVDVIEPLRPVVDGQLLALRERRTFGKREFFETRQGDCRLIPPLTQLLGGEAVTVNVWTCQWLAAGAVDIHHLQSRAGGQRLAAPRHGRACGSTTRRVRPDAHQLGGGGGG